MGREKIEHNGRGEGEEYALSRKGRKGVPGELRGGEGFRSKGVCAEGPRPSSRKHQNFRGGIDVKKKPT